MNLRYIINRPLSSGGMGLTFIAYDNILEREVVVKTMNPGLLEGNCEYATIYKSLFKDEAKNQAGLTHPNIANVFDYYEKEGIPYIVMERVEGQSLDQLDYFFNPSSDELLKELLIIFEQVTNGIIYAHKSNIIHRDIKPGNIMYDPEEKKAKIIDFGLSKLRTYKRDFTCFGGGTPNYNIPPEVIVAGDDEEIINEINEEQRDIYGLGFTIYHMLTGEKPYPDNKWDELPKRISDYRNDINEEIDQIVSQMLIPNPKYRIGSLEPLLEALRKQINRGYKFAVNIPSFKIEHRIRDSVHGYIPISNDEIEAIDNETFQRLRGIKQLGTTYLTYPGTVHTRFEHSLGVMHTATKIFDTIIHKNKNILEWDGLEIKKQRQMLRLASLLHDIGHPPFSHVGDNLFSAEIQNHERMAGKIIKETELARIIDKIGQRNGSFTHREIAGIIEGNFISNYSLIKQIFSGNVLDADRMDYLIRDSMMAGVKYGYYDMEHLIRTVNVDFSYGEPILAIDKAGIHALEEFVLARYYMFIQVYLHKTRRIYDRILEECIKSILNIDYNGFLPANVDEFLQLDDHYVMQFIKNNDNIYTRMYKRREHLKLIYENFPHLNDRQLLLNKEIINRINYKGYLEDNVLIDQYKKPLIKFSDEESNPMITVIDKNGESYPIEDVSYILSNIKKPIYLFRVYAKQDMRYEIEKLIRECEVYVS